MVPPTFGGGGRHRIEMLKGGGKLAISNDLLGNAVFFSESSQYNQSVFVSELTCASTCV